MYGKHFQSTYTGSMVGSGPTVFAVWGYVIANTRDSMVELNPVILATILGCKVEEIDAAIDLLCSEDEKSRSKEEDGRRLIKKTEYSYFVPTYEKYRNIRNENERREYMRNYMRKYRDKEQEVTDVKVNSKPRKPQLAHSDTDSYSDTSKPMSGKPDPKAILIFLNEKTGKKYQPVKANLSLISARLKEYSEDQLRQVIAKKCREWGTDDKMAQYLRPKTLFNATNFANYAGELV